MAQPNPLTAAIAQRFAPGSSAGLTFLNQLLAARNVDPNAADAVFSQEGASGGIGDGGHAFGPGQFNNAGGVWTGRYAGLTPEQENAQAWSSSGLTELANDVGNVASGLKGTSAIANIVSRFERPADQSGEISRADQAYGQPLPSGADVHTPETVAASLAAPTAKTGRPALNGGELSKLVKYLLA